MKEQTKSSVKYSEIYDILNVLGNDYISKIPHSFYEEIEKNRDLNYKSDFILEDGTIDENKIAKETVALFSILYMKYFSDDIKENERLLKKFKENEIIHQNELSQKYNVDVFSKEDEKNIEYNKEITEENKELTKIKKENVFMKILNWIKSFINK